MGRRAGSSNRGYFFRKGRGWYATINGRMAPLRDLDKTHLRDKSLPVATLKSAYRRIIAEQNGEVNNHTELQLEASKPTAPVYTVTDICSAYLAKAESDESQATYSMRADTLRYCQLLWMKEVVRRRLLGV